MAISFTWAVKNMHKVTETGAVFKVEWSCEGVDSETDTTHTRTGSYRNKKSVTTDGIARDVQVIPDHTASGFKAYADLTEADVLAWCKADGVQAHNEGLIASNITNKIAASANSTGMPWAAE
jgi:hypothetical protein